MSKLSYPKSKIKIVLLENIHPKAVEIFQKEGYTNVEALSSALKGQELIDKIKDAHIVGIRSRTNITREVFEKCNKLLTLGCFCIGTNQVDLQAGMMKGIPVFNDPVSNTRSVAEMVLGLAIVLMRDLFNKNAAAHAGQWAKVSTGSHELRGKTIGIVGYGRIGMQVSVLAEAMGMNVVFYDIEQKLPLGNAKNTYSLKGLFSISDIITLHVPETSLTHNLVDESLLKLMKKDAFIINTSRGKVVDTPALAKALKSKSIAGAAIDVFHNEPENHFTPFVNELQKLDNVVLTPHIGGATEEAQENIAMAVSQKLIYFMDRGSTDGVTNFPALSLSQNLNTHRILHIHHNVPGMLSQINTLFGQRSINISAQYLKTNPEIGYVVFDIDKSYEGDLIEALRNIKGTIRARILY